MWLLDVRCYSVQSLLLFTLPVFTDASPCFCGYGSFYDLQKCPVGVHCAILEPSRATLVLGEGAREQQQERGLWTRLSFFIYGVFTFAIFNFILMNAERLCN